MAAPAVKRGAGAGARVRVKAESVGGAKVVGARVKTESAGGAKSKSGSRAKGGVAAAKNKSVGSASENGVSGKLIAGAKLSAAEKPARMAEILRVLDREYSEAECSLTFQTPFQLLVATILSAQCTDERVNRVTPALFAKFPGPREMSRANLGELEQLIRTTGFFKNKALSILTTSKDLVEKHGGEVPRDLDALVELRGVGRKTANVVLGVAYGIPGLVVDTHVGRLSRRLGMTRETDPVKVEQDMMKIVERQLWTHFGHLMIYHGRAVCTARRAMCEECPVARLCPRVGV